MEQGNVIESSEAGKELIAANIKAMNPELIFTPGKTDFILNEIRKKAFSLNRTLTTETGAGRRDIASMASKVAKSKTFLDSVGKELVSTWKQKAKFVDIERKKIRDELDVLKTEIRQPLTDWENTERERIEKIEKKIEEIKSLGVFECSEMSADGLFNRIEELKSIVVDETFKEFEHKATVEKEHAQALLIEKYQARKQYERDQVELEKLRVAEAERKIKEVQEKAEQEAKEKAAIEAKTKAEEKIKQAEREKQEAIRRQKESEHREREAKVRKQEEIALAVKQERERVEAAHKDEEWTKAEAARQALEKAEAERKTKKDEDRKRQEDEAHKGKVHLLILESLESIPGVEDEIGEDILKALIDDKIPYVRINY